MTEACLREWHAGFVDGLVFAVFLLLFLISCLIALALIEALREGA